MSIPTHRADCQTWTFATNCRDCGRHIYVLQCTCGSAVLLDERQPPWPKHECVSGIGGSGYSGWEAVDILRAHGVPIVPSILDKVFPKTAAKKQTLKSVLEDIRAVKPKGRARHSLLAVLRELHTQTNRTVSMKALGGVGAKLLNLPSGSFEQITLVDNGRHPNLSYTCILPRRLGLPKTAKNKIVFAQIEGRAVGSHAIWLVKDIRVI